MSNRFVQEGERLEVVAAAAVVVNDVDVVGTGLLGVALNSAAIGEVVVYGIKGVWRIPKISAAVIAQGDTVLFDVSADAVDDNAAIPAVGDFLAGRAFEAAGAGVLEVAVDINQTAPTVT